jgi:hypothetical protein
MIFCVCVTILCCYTVHVVLQDKFKNNNSVYNAMIQADKKALNKPLKIKIKHEYTLKQETFKNTDRTQFLDRLLNITPHKNNSLDNQYPIKPKNLVSTGYGLDLRV